MASLAVWTRYQSVVGIQAQAIDENPPAVRRTHVVLSYIVYRNRIRTVLFRFYCFLPVREIPDPDG